MALNPSVHTLTAGCAGLLETTQGQAAGGRHYTVAKLLQHKRAAAQSQRAEGGEAERVSTQSSFIAEATNEEWLVFGLLDLMMLDGANVNHRNMAGLSPLLVACQAAWSPGLVDMLLDTYEADPAARTADVRNAPQSLSMRPREGGPQYPWITTHPWTVQQPRTLESSREVMMHGRQGD